MDFVCTLLAKLTTTLAVWHLTAIVDALDAPMDFN
jgi:hypothetical protein